MDSTTKVAQLPEDVIIQILSRLPVKSVGRSKSVCKTWNHFLKTPSFISMHHKVNKGSVSQLLLCSSDGKGYVNFSLRSNHRSARVLSPDFEILVNPGPHYVHPHSVHLAQESCSGIVCYRDRTSVFLCNPATREFKQLPPTFGNHHIWSYISCIALGCDSTNICDIKLLCLFYILHTSGPINGSYRAEIFTLSSNTWKLLHWGLDQDVVFTLSIGLFFANSFHFIVSYRESQRQAIACCDFHTERYRTMDFPLIGKGICKSLLVYKEFLSAVVCKLPYEEREEKFMDIWIMKDYGCVESWTKLFTVRLPSGIFTPLCFWTDEDALLLGLDEKKLVSYHPDTQSLESIEIHGYNSQSHLLVHQETLVSIM